MNLRCVLLTCLTWFAAPLHAAITTIRFDNLAIDTRITAQFEPQGVVFFGASSRVRIVEADPPGTFSGTRALEVEYSGDLPEHAGPMRFRFTSLQRRVLVHVGQHFAGNDPDSDAVLRVFDDKNGLIEKKYVAIGAGPRRITIPLEIDAGKSVIRRAEVQFLKYDMLDEVYFETDIRGVEIIDSLVFEGEDPPPPPPDEPPVVRITLPADGQVFFGDPHIRFGGTVDEDHGLGRLTFSQVYLDADPDPAAVPIDWAGNAPRFTFPLFPQVFGVNLATGRNRLTVEALDSRNQPHSASIEVTLAPAPIVFMDSPADEAEVSDDEIAVTGRIIKPYGILPRARVTLEVEGSGAGPVAVDSLIGNARDGYTFSSRTALSNRFPATRHRLVVAATDEGGTTGRAFADVTVRRPNRILAEHVEVTQAVISRTLVAGRRTVVRVYAAIPAGAPAGILAGVRAELRSFRGGIELPLSPLSPTGPDTLDVDPGETLADRQNDQSRTWNFVLPGSWRNTAGDLDLVASIDPGNTLGECESCEEDNVLTRSITLVEGENLRVQPIRVGYLEDGSRRRPSDAQITAALEGILRTYPYGSIDILATEDKDTGVDLGDDLEEGMEDILEEVYDEFTCFDSDLADIDDWDEIFGWLVDNVFGCSWSSYRIGFLDNLSSGSCPGGLAFLDSPACVSEVNPWVAAQELAHDFGINHAGNSHGEDEGGGFDEDFPYPHGGIGGTGFDTDAMVAIPAAGPYPIGSPAVWDSCRQCNPGLEVCHTHDFMSYGNGPNWISDYTWENLFSLGFTGGSIGIFGGGGGEGAGNTDPDAVGEAAGGGGEVSGAVLHVTGKVREDGSVMFRHFYTATPPAGFKLPAGKGSFEARTLDARGKILASHFFEAARSTHGHGGGRISTLAAFPPGAAKVVILRDGRPVFDRSAGSQAPSVTVLHPNGGEKFAAGDTIRIAWEAADADGEELRYGVQVSSDDGRTWRSAAFNLRSTELELKADGVPGGAACRVRVMASDGMLAARDASDGAFSIEPKPPFPVILFPRPGAILEPGDLQVLEGTASDPEEGPLAGKSLVWSSDRDGVLGTGRSADVRKLSPGEHRLRLAAKDGSGAQGIAEIIVSVGSRPAGKTFLRGNVDGLGDVDISDAIGVLEFLFLGKQGPACLDAADVNDDGQADISDAIGLLEFLFLGGKSPRPPFPQAGTDPTPDGLGC